MISLETEAKHIPRLKRQKSKAVVRISMRQVILYRAKLSALVSKEVLISYCGPLQTFKSFNRSAPVVHVKWLETQSERKEPGCFQVQLQSFSFGEGTTFRAFTFSEFRTRPTAGLFFGPSRKRIAYEQKQEPIPMAPPLSALTQFSVTDTVGPKLRIEAKGGTNGGDPCDDCYR